MNFFIKRFLNFFIASAILIGSVFSSVFVTFAAGTIYYDENFKAQNVSSIPDNAFFVSVVPSKMSVEKGEQFYVDYIVKNNPGFVGFAFMFIFDSNIIKPLTSLSVPESCQLTYKVGSDDEIIFSNEKLYSDILETGKKDVFYSNALLMSSGTTLAETNNDGNIIRVYYEAIKEGNSKINFSGLGGTMFVDKNAKTIPVYIKNSSVEVTKPESGIHQVVPEKNNSSGGGSANKTETTTASQQVTNEPTTEPVSDAPLDNKPEEDKKDDNVDTNENTDKTENTDNSNNASVTYNIPKEEGSPKNFTDLSSVPWAADSIGILSSVGIINGIDETHFNPRAFTSRGDFAVAISRMLGLEGNQDNKFKDVPNSKYYAKHIALANAFGIINGTGNNNFGPDVNISRQDVMVIASRTLEKLGKLQTADVSILNSFKDSSSISDYAKQSVSNLVKMGIIKGSDGNINPKANITRAEMAVIMNAVYQIVK